MDIRNEHSQRVDRYFGDMFAIVAERFGDTDAVVTTRRRCSPEEGFGNAWPLLALKCGERCWLSISPTIRAASTSGTHETYCRELIHSLRGPQPFSEKPPSLVFLPATVPPRIELADGATLRRIREAPQLWSQTRIPEESIAAGTAFGVYVEGELVSWAEATPLSVTEQFGVMLVGIETHPEHRHRGYAKGALGRLTQEVCDRALTPLYFCGSRNEASQRTALASGYALYGKWWRFSDSEVENLNQAPI